MKKEKLAIIGANDFQNKLIMKAKEMGYETHVFAWACGDIGEKTADYFYPVSITEKEEILEICREISPAGICSIGSDLAVPTVNYVADKLGLVGNDEICSVVATDKYEMRKAFMENGLPTPKFVLADAEDVQVPEDMQYPLIVKPTDRSGSRGVSQIYKLEQLDEAIEYAKEVSFNKKVIIEEFVEGTEYSIEYISYEGKHHFLAATKKFTTGSPHFVELAHFQPANIDDAILENIKKILREAFDVLHITDSAVHAEVMVGNDGTVKIIEIGARMGGDCIGSDLVKISTGLDFVEMVIDVSCGNTLKFEKKSEPKIGFIKFILSVSDVDNYNKVKEQFAENICETSFDDKADINVSGENSAERAGHYIMSFDRMEDLKKVCELTEIESCLN